jgi:dTDP-L-rhamnose 4-epimerase
MARYLVTGGAGFIGRAVCRELLSKGHEVRVLDCLVEQVHQGQPAPDLGDAAFYEGDVRDAALVARALRGVDGVVHLAAEVGVGQSMYEIDRYVGANDLGTAVLLQQLINQPVKRIVVASSMSVYGEGLYETADGERVADARRSPERVSAGLWDISDPQGRALVPVATDESKQPDLASIYALTKYVQERAVLIFGEAYSIDAIALRLFNVFGPGQALSNPYTGVLANFSARIANGLRPTVFEDGRQMRDFVHVDDVARAFRLALEKPEAASHAINIGSGRSYTIADVARMVARAMGRDIEPDIILKARSGDIRNCFADIGLAEELLGFHPRTELEEGLPELADWVASQQAPDRGHEMRRQLEERGLVSG